VGGWIGEFLTLYDQSRNDSTPPSKRKPLYWFMSFLMALAGGSIAVFYGFKEVHVLGAAYLGASAPVLLKQGFSKFAPPSNPPIS
jgi:hypothetical protein